MGTYSDQPPLPILHLPALSVILPGEGICETHGIGRSRGIWSGNMQTIFPKPPQPTSSVGLRVQDLCPTVTLQSGGFLGHELTHRDDWNLINYSFLLCTSPDPINVATLGQILFSAAPIQTQVWSTGIHGAPKSRIWSNMSFHSMQNINQKKDNNLCKYRSMWMHVSRLQTEHQSQILYNFRTRTNLCHSLTLLPKDT